MEPDESLTPSLQYEQVSLLHQVSSHNRCCVRSQVDTAIKTLATRIVKAQQIWPLLNMFVTNLHQHRFTLPFDAGDDQINEFQTTAS